MVEVTEDVSEALVAAYEAGGENPEEAIQKLSEELEVCKKTGDLAGQAALYLAASDIHASTGGFQDAFSTAMLAHDLCQQMGDTRGQCQALQLNARVNLADGQHQTALEIIDKALVLSQKAEDGPSEANLLLMMAETSMAIQTASYEQNSTAVWDHIWQGVKGAQKAVQIAREWEELELLGSALCTLSQVSCAAKRGQDAVAAGAEAVSAFRELGDKSWEAYALVQVAKGYIVEKKLRKAWETASKALLMCAELGDEEGTKLAEDTIGAIEDLENPIEEPVLLGSMQAAQAAQMGQMQAMGGRGGEVGIPEVQTEAVREKVRLSVMDIVGVEEYINNESPLMNMGLTSQSAVLLRNSFMKSFPGTSLPFTLMFDYPSIGSLTNFFVGREMTN